MLVEFSVGNFWSFREVETLQMQAAKISSENKELDKSNVITVSDDLKLLKTKAIFGANASGKSNLYRAMVAFLRIVGSSLSNDEVLKESIVPFALDEKGINQPSFFQVVIVIDKVIYRYGFEATSSEIKSEWLFSKDIDPGKKTAERYCYKREGMDMKLNRETFKEASGIKHVSDVPLYRQNSLFLSVLSAFNRPVSKAIHYYITKRFFANLGLSTKQSWQIAMEQTKNSTYRQRLLPLLQSVDPTILDLDFWRDGEASEDSQEESNFSTDSLILLRKIDDGGDHLMGFQLESEEAEGTKKIFSLSPFIFNTLENSGVFFIDEFDAQLHPKLTRKIIDLYHNPETNLQNAQLIFVTHDSNLLDNKLLRRDQICFANKKKNGATELYSLVEIKGVRNDASFEKDYLLGKYRAVPDNLNVLEDSIKDLYNAKTD